MIGVDKKWGGVEERRSEREQKREMFKQTSITEPGKLTMLLPKNTHTHTYIYTHI